MSWRPEVKVAGEDTWHKNGLRFATEAEAKQSATDLMMRWMLVTNCRAVECDDPVNYKIEDNRLICVE